MTRTWGKERKAEIDVVRVVGAGMAAPLIMLDELSHMAGRSGPCNPPLTTFRRIVDAGKKGIGLVALCERRTFQPRYDSAARRFPGERRNRIVVRCVHCGLNGCLVRRVLDFLRCNRLLRVADDFRAGYPVLGVSRAGGCGARKERHGDRYQDNAGCSHGCDVGLTVRHRETVQARHAVCPV